MTIILLNINFKMLDIYAPTEQKQYSLQIGNISVTKDRCVQNQHKNCTKGRSIAKLHPKHRKK